MEGIEPTGSGQRDRPTVSDVYKAVADRERLSDRLAWQLPAVVFAAAAVLFTVLSDKTAEVWARYGACAGLMVLGAGFSLVLLRMRKSAILDSEWLSAVVKGDPWPYSPHGAIWAARRRAMPFNRAFKSPWAATFGLWVCLLGVAACGFVGAFCLLVANSGWTIGEAFFVALVSAELAGAAGAGMNLWLRQQSVAELRKLESEEKDQPSSSLSP